MTTQQLFVLATGVYFAALAIVTYFTRAARRRFLGALAWIAHHGVEKRASGRK